MPKASQAFLLATSDSQTLLALAYGVNFLSAGKCDLSAYHFTIAVKIGLIICSNFVMSNFIIRKFWNVPLSAFLRYVSILLLIASLGWMTSYQNRRSNPEWQPPSTRSSSAILLPASCFLDADLDIFKKIDNGTKLDNISHPMRKSWEF